MTNLQYLDYLEDKRKSFLNRFFPDGTLMEQFNSSNLSNKFVPYFRENYRIQVQDKFGDKHSGYVGITTGWKPVFILVYNKRCYGSSILLSDEDIIIKAYKGQYV